MRGAACLIGGAALAFGCAATALDEPLPAPDSQPHRAATSAADEVEPGYAQAAVLTPLRQKAALGDATAALQLIDGLVDGYEVSGGDQKLYEAMIWIDRYHYTDAIVHSHTVSHVAARHCTHEVVRFHWLCASGE